VKDDLSVEPEVVSSSDGFILPDIHSRANIGDKNSFLEGLNGSFAKLSK